MINKLFDILPDEHVYSWLARVYLLSGQANPSSFLSPLGFSSRFLKPHAVFCPAISKSLRSLIRDTDSKRELLSRHTAFSLWGVSLSPETIDGLSRELMSGELAKSHHMNEQLLFGFDKSWHGCRQCMVEDADRYGISYWHVSHQLPSITICDKHGSILVTPDEPLKYLVDLTLPFQVQAWQPVLSSHTYEIDEWNRFLLQVFAWFRADSNNAFRLKEQIDILIGLSGQHIRKRREWTEQNLPEIENCLGTSLLKHLFRAYKIKSKYRNNNILATFLAPLHQILEIRNPIYWFAVAYWKRDQLPILNGVMASDSYPALSYL